MGRVLCKLPPREMHACVAVAGDVPADTIVEDYVSRMESVPDIDALEFGLEDIMGALYGQGVRAPVRAEDVLTVLSDVLGPDARARYRGIPNFLPRVLKALNGPDYFLVPTEVMHEAIRREHVMRQMPHGWGVPDPPSDAIAQRLLGSAGANPHHFLAYKTIPPASRQRLMAAWNAACERLGWDAFHPVKDLAGAVRKR